MGAAQLAVAIAAVAGDGAATTQTLANVDDAALEYWRTVIAQAADRAPKLPTLRVWAKVLLTHECRCSQQRRWRRSRRGRPEQLGRR